jgi:hypothetical protein
MDEEDECATQTQCLPMQQVDKRCQWRKGIAAKARPKKARTVSEWTRPPQRAPGQQTRTDLLAGQKQAVAADDQSGFSYSTAKLRSDSQSGAKDGHILVQHADSVSSARYPTVSAARRVRRAMRFGYAIFKRVRDW